MSGVYARFVALDTEVYGVNFDGRESHQAFIDQLSLPFDLLIDDGMAVSRLYDSLKPDGSGILRHVFIIGKDGAIYYREQGMPDPEDLLEVLAGLKDA